MDAVDAIKLILLILAFSWDSYKIKKGHHYSNHERVTTTEDNVLRFNAIFSRSCLYDINATDGEGDLNKLYGFTDCGSSVHQNSVRFAWRHDGLGNIEIFAYLYVDGERNFFKMGQTRPRVKDFYEIHADADRYYLRFNAVDTTLARTKRCGYIQERLRNYPYFGGDYPAPNTMVIWIREFNNKPSGVSLH